MDALIRISARARRDLFVCAAPPLGRRPEHRTDRLTPVRPQMGRLAEHGVQFQHASPDARAECAHC